MTITEPRQHPTEPEDAAPGQKGLKANAFASARCCSAPR
jgi:hypothetical protein